MIYMIHKTYIITGPTASGKSDFAHLLAKKINAVIINCDSVQIYSGIENISASPFAEQKPDSNSEIESVPYRLFSVLPLTEQISVVDYLDMAKQEFDAAAAQNRPVIFVGGTGYYINALVKGISPIPDVSDENRKKARDMVRDYPDAAKQILGTDCDSLDPQRMARALEVFLQTGKPLADWQVLPRQGALCPDAFKILVNPPKEVLNTRIEKRIPQMISGGAYDEAKSVIKSGWDENRAIGASQLCKLIRGEIDNAQCNENWIVRTRQYAKRQRTWFAGQYDCDLEIKNVPTEKDVDDLLK